MARPTTNLGVEDDGLKEPSASQKEGWWAHAMSFLRAGQVGAEEAAEAAGKVNQEAGHLPASSRDGQAVDECAPSRPERLHAKG